MKTGSEIIRVITLIVIFNVNTGQEADQLSIYEPREGAEGFSLPKVSINIFYTPGFMSTMNINGYKSIQELPE